MESIKEQMIFDVRLIFMKEKNTLGHQKDYRSLGVYVEKIENTSLSAYRASRMQTGTYTFLFVITGEMRISEGDKTLSIPDGQGILLYPGEYIPVAADTGEDCQWIEVHFAGKAASDTLSYLEMKPFMVFSFTAASVTSALDSIMTCQAAGEYFRAAIYLQILMVSIMEGGEQRSRDSEMQQVYMYITEHFQEPIDLTMLASMYGTSVSYFTRKFRQKYGKTPIQFLNQIRIINARLLLETTHLKIREVAEACGFEKLEYFCYVFKKQEGCTPTQFRINRKYMT